MVCQFWRKQYPTTFVCTPLLDENGLCRFWSQTVSYQFRMIFLSTTFGWKCFVPNVVEYGVPNLAQTVSYQFGMIFLSTTFGWKWFVPNVAEYGAPILAQHSVLPDSDQFWLYTIFGWKWFVLILTKRYRTNFGWYFYPPLLVENVLCLMWQSMVCQFWHKQYRTMQICLL